jgi:hypothetical protein
MMSKGRQRIREPKAGVIYTSWEPIFQYERQQFTELILQNCRDKWSTRHNLNQLLALACMWSVDEGKPLVRLRGGNWSMWEPSDDPEPERQPTASDVLRLRGMGVRWTD